MVISELSTASYISNCLADNKKRRAVFTWLKEKDSHICCLQETHSISGEKNAMVNLFQSLVKKFKRCYDPIQKLLES